MPGKASYKVQYNENADAQEFIIEGFDQIQCMLEDFGRYVLDDKPVWPAPEEAIKSAKVMDALMLSAREQRAVDV